MSRLGLQTVPVQSALSLSLSLSLSQEREKCSPLCNVVYVFCLALLYPEVQTRAKSVLLGSQSLELKSQQDPRFFSTIDLHISVLFSVEYNLVYMLYIAVLSV